MTSQHNDQPFLASTKFKITFIIPRNIIIDKTALSSLQSSLEVSTCIHMAVPLHLIL
jgi:hypothetical protein